MAQAPKRPVVLRFIVGKGLVKRRQESADTGRAIIEQATIAFAQNTWDEAKVRLGDQIQNDVRAELARVAGDFRRHVIGAPGNQRGLVGTLTTVAKGADAPKESLGSLPRWAPRTRKYLQRKNYRQPYGAGHSNWFDNTGWRRPASKLTGRTWPINSGLLKEFFGSEIGSSDAGGALHLGSGGVFEDLFGDITVRVQRNNSGWGVNQGVIKVDQNGHMQMQLATVSVRALGSITDAMLTLSGNPNTALLDQIQRAGEREVALHLRGGRGHYRPALEPYLKFFLRRALPYAVTQRVARGVIGTTLAKIPKALR